MAMTSSSGAAQAAIFTDVSDQPGSQVGALISPGSYSNALASTSFTASGITLAANTTYWVVLSASSGNFNWAWTDSNIGSGVGFTHTWSGSDDAGSSWLTFHDSPQIGSPMVVRHRLGRNASRREAENWRLIPALQAFNNFVE
jgi:hypothetical protein